MASLDSNTLFAQLLRLQKEYYETQNESLKGELCDQLTATTNLIRELVSREGKRIIRLNQQIL